MAHCWWCHIHEWDMSHTWMSHVRNINESCHTYEWIVSHTWMSHGTHTHEYTPEGLFYFRNYIAVFHFFGHDLCIFECIRVCVCVCVCVCSCVCVCLHESPVSHRNGSWLTNESWLTHEWVMSHIRFGLGVSLVSVVWSVLSDSKIHMYSYVNRIEYVDNVVIKRKYHTHTHTHTRTHTHKRTHIHIRIHTHTHTHTRTLTHTIHSHTPTHTHTHTRSCLHLHTPYIHTHLHTHTHTHTLMHTHTLARTHTHTRARAHTHTHTHTYKPHAHWARTTLKSVLIWANCLNSNLATCTFTTHVLAWANCWNLLGRRLCWPSPPALLLRAHLLQAHLLHTHVRIHLGNCWKSTWPPTTLTITSCTLTARTYIASPLTTHTYVLTWANCWKSTLPPTSLTISCRSASVATYPKHRQHLVRLFVCVCVCMNACKQACACMCMHEPCIHVWMSFKCTTSLNPPLPPLCLQRG